MQHLCPCSSDEVETTERVLPYRSYYRDVRATFISPWLGQFLRWKRQQDACLLLSGKKNPIIADSVAKFLAAAINILTLMLKECGPVQLES